MNFTLKVQKLQTNLDIWKSRGLTLYGKVRIIKSLGLTFYRDILIAFDEIKTLYNYDQGTDTILFNNKDILVDGKPLFIREWFT